MAYENGGVVTNLALRVDGKRPIGVVPFHGGFAWYLNRVFLHGFCGKDNSRAAFVSNSA